MNEYGVVLESGAVRFERLLPGPLERVWSYLTQSEKRGTWLASGEIEPRVGGAADLLFKHSEITSEQPPERYREMNDKGWPSKGTVTRYEPMTALAMTWPGEGDASSEVTFELVPEGDGSVPAVSGFSELLLRETGPGGQAASVSTRFSRPGGDRKAHV